MRSTMIFGVINTLWWLLLASVVVEAETIHPVEIKGRHFVDTVTKKPFFIRGVDYQPGGSSGVSDTWDPLSNINDCARDIYLFQELKVNTIRVYSVNPELNHDECMSLLASAGIYLVLDVNSPGPNQNLNRYDPWHSYNVEYMKHVFRVVEQFAYYNNTLAFFAGNEVVNDRKSAQVCPGFLKAVIRDIKAYSRNNLPRYIPVGYSAADDLQYRISLSKYLECGVEAEAVDFYGVNSYQWCGSQTFHTSGYDSLVEDYEYYTKPVFLSEYGCNEVTPRLFEEVLALHSKEMARVFSGGLIYEFAQESNNYGLVDYDDKGNAILLPDFKTLKSIYAQAPEPFIPKYNGKEEIVPCEDEYENLDVSKGVPKSVAEDMISNGVDVEIGRYVTLKAGHFVSNHMIILENGKTSLKDPKVKPVNSINETMNYFIPKGRFKKGKQNDIKKNKNIFSIKNGSFDKLSDLKLAYIGISIAIGIAVSAIMAISSPF